MLPVTIRKSRYTHRAGSIPSPVFFGKNTKIKLQFSELIINGVIARRAQPDVAIPSEQSENPTKFR